MAKGGLSKLKCMIKRWHSSSSRISRTPSTVGGSLSRVLGEEEDPWRRCSVARAAPASFHHGVPPGLQLHPVYVGKSRRRYLIAADLLDHPLIQNLVDRSGAEAIGGYGGGGGTTVGCEVVLFDHLLWMLENADPQPESLDELVEYYAC